MMALEHNKLYVDVPPKSPFEGISIIVEKCIRCDVETASHRKV
jgi:hypothetical protein